MEVHGRAYSSGFLSVGVQLLGKQDEAFVGVLLSLHAVSISRAVFLKFLICNLTLLSTVHRNGDIPGCFHSQSTFFLLSLSIVMYITCISEVVLVRDRPGCRSETISLFYCLILKANRNPTLQKSVKRRGGNSSNNIE